MNTKRSLVDLAPGSLIKAANNLTFREVNIYYVWLVCSTLRILANIASPN